MFLCYFIYGKFYWKSFKIIGITNLTEKDYYVLKLYDFPNTCMYVNVYVYVCIHTFQLRYDTKCYETHVLLILPPFIGKYIEGTVCVNIYNMLVFPTQSRSVLCKCYFVRWPFISLISLVYCLSPYCIYVYIGWIKGIWIDKTIVTIGSYF